MASAKSPYKGFGGSVALHADTAVIGAGDDDKGPYAGAAYVFVRSGTTWFEQAKLTASDGAPENFFGASVAVWGDSALIAAPQNAENGPYSGAAYVFVRSGTTWTEQVKLPVPDGQAGDNFGRRLALSRDTVCVGAYGDDDNAAESGSTYVFERSGSSWSPVAKLYAENPAPSDNFGWAVALEGDTALVGCPRDDGLGKDAGAAFVFVRAPSGWVQQAKLTAGDGAPQNKFGTAVALAEDLALVATRQGTPSSAAYVFARVGTTWVEQAKLTTVDDDSNKFGFSVSIATRSVVPHSHPGVLALVGAYGDDDNGINSGAAYLFERHGKKWASSKVLASDAVLDDSFGYAVALDCGAALVGAPGVNGPAGPDVGSVYVFEARSKPPPLPYCSPKSGLICGYPVLTHTGVPSTSIPNGFVVSAAPALGNRAGVFLYTDQGRASTPFQGGLLCLTPAIRRSVPVNSGGTPAACDGVFSIDWNSFAQGLLGGNPQPFLLTPGQQVNVQVWGRDTVATGSLLSDGLEYFVCE